MTSVPSSWSRTESHPFFFDSRSLAVTSRSLSSQSTCAEGQWSGHPRTSPARSTSLRCQTPLPRHNIEHHLSVMFTLMGLLFFLSWRLVKGQSCWSSLRSTVWSTTGTEPLLRPSTHTWGNFTHQNKTWFIGFSLLLHCTCTFEYSHLVSGRSFFTVKCAFNALALS